MVASDERIEQALELLQGIEDEEERPPAMVVMPPDSGDFIRGNSAGFVRLAMAALRAAKSEDQNFADAPWVTEVDFDWGIAGLKFDALAHMDLPETKVRTRFQMFWRQLVGYGIFIAFLGCLGVGFVTIEEAVRKFFWP